MAKFFISYSTRNQQLAERFIEFLRLGMDVRKSDIFCTAFPEDLPTGENFIEKIRTEMERCDVVISIITEEYLNSTFCIVEMGVAWGLRKRYIPLLLVPYGRLNGTPLCGIQMRKMNSWEDLSAVYDELISYQVVGENQTAEFYKRVPDFINYVDKMMSGNDMIEKDEEGYYTTVIREIRKVKANEIYCCYGIKGQIQDPPDNNKADSDWLFFKRGRYPALQVGDRVRFKVTESEVRYFSDLGNARNLYLSRLEKV